MKKLDIIKSIDNVTTFLLTEYGKMLSSNEDEKSEEKLLSELLIRFKANILSKYDTIDLITETLQIIQNKDSERLLVPFVPNELQTKLVRMIESEKEIEFSKPRQKGITSILAAYIALKSYLKKTKTIFVVPSGQMGKYVWERIGMFIDNLQKELKLCPVDKSLYKIRARYNFRLYNDSYIKIVSGHDVHVLCGQGDVNYLILDELYLIGQAKQFLEYGLPCIGDQGKIIKIY